MEHHTINYIEMPSNDLERTKRFFHTVFGWAFEDYGPDYTAINSDGIDGGFYRVDLAMAQATGSALVVFYSQDLEATQCAVEQAGGTINRPIFGFPGGRRFHFLEPSGNELAVWSDKLESD